MCYAMRKIFIVVLHPVGFSQWNQLISFPLPLFGRQADLFRIKFGSYMCCMVCVPSYGYLFTVRSWWMLRDHVEVSQPIMRVFIVWDFWRILITCYGLALLRLWFRVFFLLVDELNKQSSPSLEGWFVRNLGGKVVCVVFDDLIDAFLVTVWWLWL